MLSLCIGDDTLRIKRIAHLGQQDKTFTFPRRSQLYSRSLNLIQGSLMLPLNPQAPLGFRAVADRVVGSKAILGGQGDFVSFLMTPMTPISHERRPVLPMMGRLTKSLCPPPLCRDSRYLSLEGGVV